MLALTGARLLDGVSSGKSTSHNEPESAAGSGGRKRTRDSENIGANKRTSVGGEEESSAVSS